MAVSVIPPHVLKRFQYATYRPTEVCVRGWFGTGQKKAQPGIGGAPPTVHAPE